jgi:hypothetical protein
MSVVVTGLQWVVKQTRRYSQHLLRRKGDVSIAEQSKLKAPRPGLFFFADLACYLPQLLVRTFQELLKEPELMHQLERRRMNRIATKVAQKIGMLLKNRDLDARARE